VPFIRLSDNYIDNPKIVALSEGSFCLWHEGMAYARKHQTDGIITFNAMRAFRFYTKGREKQLAAPHVEGANPLWVLIPATGYKIHDYLDWNLSREEEQSERSATAARVRRFRDQRRNAVTSTVTEPLRNADVPDRIRTGEGSEVLSEKGSGGKPTARSKRPIFTGQRLTVFEWQFDELCKTLGSHADEFGLDEWFYRADAQALASGLIRTSRDWWPWLEQATIAEAQRRGLPIGVVADPYEAEVAALLKKGPSVRP
jgi:hypothetical protein